MLCLGFLVAVEGAGRLIPERRLMMGSTSFIPFPGEIAPEILKAIVSHSS